MSATNPIAVIGATGQQGGAVLAALRDRDAPVRAIVRDEEKGSAISGPGIEFAVAELDDAEALARAFEDVSAVFAMTTMLEPDGTEGEVTYGRTIADAAKAAGVTHLVYNSVGGAERDTGIPHFESKWKVEQYLAEIDVPHVVLRPVFFMENLSGVMPPSVEDGEVVLRAPLSPGVPLQMIAVEDIGKAAASALLDRDAVPGGSVELMGDELTAEQIADAFGTANHMPARFEELPVSVLDDDDTEAMFEWFATLPAYQGDAELTRTLAGGQLVDFAAWAARNPLEQS